MKLSVTEDINGQKYVRMSDEKRNVTMTNQEAIKILDEYKHCFWDKLYEPICMAIKALEQEPCDKYINEIDHLRKYISKLETQIVEQEPICIAKVEFDEDKLRKIVKEQVARIEITTEQEPNKGHWIVHPKGIYAHLVCDKCLSNAPYDCQTNYCPNCGARMESEDCRDCKKWEDCPCGKDGHKSETAQGYSIGECKDFEPQESEEV